MAAQSFTMAQGASGFLLSDFTAGTNAPSAGSFELRFNTTDSNGKNITREAVILFCEAAIRMLQQGGATVDLIPVAGAALPNPPAV